MSNAIDNKLEDLYKDLAFNHVKNSLLDGELNNGIPRILKDKEIQNRKSSRNIVIIGSGASYDAYPKIFPLGIDSAELIEKRLKFSLIKNPVDNCGDWEFTQNLNEKYNKLKDKLYLNPQSKDNSFETRLTLMSHFFDANSIRNEISNLFFYKTFPSYFYELIAHLLKNRFIEGVINFNFDELLDQALEEELGNGRILKIISDGDCIPYSEMLTMEKLREPFYIKPHGTASHKSSLRFTKEQYLNIAPDVENLIEEIFVGRTIYKDETGNAIDKSQFNTLNLLIFGFALESIEFNNVIKKAHSKIKEGQKKLNLYFFSHKNDEEQKNTEKFKLESQLKEIDEDLANRLIIIYYNDSNISKTFSSPLNSTIDHIIKMTYANFNKLYRPKEPIRHRLVHEIFSNKAKQENLEILNYYPISTPLNFKELKKSLYFNSSNYYLDRLLFEIILVVIKNKGIIQPKESLKGINRIGIYYHKYYASFTKKDQAKSIHTILLNLGLSPELKSFSSDIYKMEKDCCFKDESIELVEWKKLIESKIENSNKNRFCSTTNKRIIDILDYLNKVENLTHVENLYNRDSLSLYPDYKDFQLNAFGHIDPINIIATSTALKYKFSDSFLHDDWKTVLIISDRGYDLSDALSTINDSDKKYKDRFIYLILSELEITVKYKIQKKCSTLKIKLYCKELPFYDHSSHIKLFFSSKDSKYEPVNAIYYYKKGFSNNINAIHLRPTYNHRNILLLLDKFLAYYLKANNFSSSSSSSSSSTKNILHLENTNQILELLNNNSKVEEFKNLNEIRKSLTKLINNSQ